MRIARVEGRTKAPAVNGEAHANNERKFSGPPPVALPSSTALLGAGFLSGSA